MSSTFLCTFDQPPSTPTKTPTKQLVPSSPIFAKPSDLFKKRVKRKLIQCSPVKSPFKTPTKSPSKCGVKRGRLDLEEDVSRTYSPLKCFQSTTNPANVVKSFSFGSPSGKQKKIVSFSPIFKKLKGSPVRKNVQFPVVSNPNKKLQLQQNRFNNFSRVLDFSEDANFFTDKFSPTKTKSSPIKTTRTSRPLDSPNVDWSLKSNIRISTNRAIPYHGTFKVVDETIGFNNFVRGVSQDSNSFKSENDSFASDLYKNLMVWQFPYLPWLKTFPRSAYEKVRTPSTIAPNSQMATDLYKAYCNSIRSLFKLLKSKHCPYFYVCCNNFTVLFRASGVSGEPEQHALISPTTSGLRKALTDDQIDFTLPFHNRKSPPKLNFATTNMSNDTSISSGIGECENNNDELDEDDEENELVINEENDQWLSSLGLSRDSFMSSDSTSVRKRITTSAVTSRTPVSRKGADLDDGTAEGKVKSLVFVRGSANVQGLLSFLINERKLCVVTSGSQAGVPPTLLAPSSFHGATCLPLDIKYKTTSLSSSSSPSSGTAEPQSLCTIDISGPILPNNLFGITKLYARFATNSAPPTSAQSTIVSTALKSEEATCSFALEAGLDNTEKQWTPMFSVPNFEDSGLDKNFLTALCSEDRQLYQPLSEIEINSNRIRYNKSVLLK